MNFRQTLLLMALVLASCFFCFSVFGQIPSSGLVAYWPLDGNYNDAGPNGIHGSNYGSTATANKFGTAGSAMDFLNPTGAVDQYATHPINATVNFSSAQNFTISFLFYLNSPWVHNGGFYDNNINYSGPGIFIWRSGGPTDYKIQFNFRNGSLASTPRPLATWQHITCVRNSGTLSIYINGVFNASGPEGAQTPSYSYPARFGTLSVEASQYNGLNGNMDEFRIYNRALSAEEIAGLALTTLPLSLTGLRAVINNNTVQLNWETYDEQNTAYFDIERSENGIQFTGLGRVHAAGNSQDRQVYSFTDAAPLSGTNFYRLKMVDSDHESSYSTVLAVRNKGALGNAVHLFPNPAKNMLHIKIPAAQAETIRISIVNATGQIILQQHKELMQGNNAITIPVQGFHKGSYTLLISGATCRRSIPFMIMP